MKIHYKQIINNPIYRIGLVKTEYALCGVINLKTAKLTKFKENITCKKCLKRLGIK